MARTLVRGMAQGIVGVRQQPSPQSHRTGKAKFIHTLCKILHACEKPSNYNVISIQEGIEGDD
jgi:hypothetical protein